MDAGEGFGRRLKDSMLAAGIENPADLAARCGISASTCKRYLTLEEADLSAKTAFRMARSLRVGVAWLIGGEGSVPFSEDAQAAISIINQLPQRATERFLAYGWRLIRRSTESSDGV